MSLHRAPFQAWRVTPKKLPWTSMETTSVQWERRRARPPPHGRAFIRASETRAGPRLIPGPGSGQEPARAPSCGRQPRDLALLHNPSWAQRQGSPFRGSQQG